MRDNRSDVAGYAVWTNPYTKKEDRFSFYFPKRIVENVLPSFLKAAYDIDVKDFNTFMQMLQDFGTRESSLEENDGFIDLCMQEYYNSPEYEEDCKQELDDYEMLNDLGEYAPDFGEEDDVID